MKQFYKLGRIKLKHIQVKSPISQKATPNDSLVYNVNATCKTLF